MNTARPTRHVPRLRGRPARRRAPPSLHPYGILARIAPPPPPTGTGRGVGPPEGRAASSPCRPPPGGARGGRHGEAAARSERKRPGDARPSGPTPRKRVVGVGTGLQSLRH